MIEVVLNDRLGKKIRVKCNEDDTIGDLKKLVAAQTGTRPEKVSILMVVVWEYVFCSIEVFLMNVFVPILVFLATDPHPEVVQCVQGPHYSGGL